MATAPVMSHASINQIKGCCQNTVAGRRRHAPRASCFSTQQAATSAVVFSSTPPAADRGGRRGHTIRSERHLWDSQLTDICACVGVCTHRPQPPACGSPGVSAESLVVKPQLERFECTGDLVNAPANDSSRLSVSSCN